MNELNRNRYPFAEFEFKICPNKQKKNKINEKQRIETCFYTVIIFSLIGTGARRMEFQFNV